ncbi:hypothetical protein CHS0354_012910 [Potamilus streckersoni]|uniref:malate synthase n=1 Tax=Potamilus streckersoni TaxID=2493646 RepID=A0AAE0VHG4_9BIVA|nr:hypothetical protein CHS0354_012910 [Potamilus streckersoni]
MSKLRVSSSYGRFWQVEGNICRSWDQKEGAVVSLQRELKKLGCNNLEVKGPPCGLENPYQTVLTPEAVSFVARLVEEFDSEVEAILRNRIVYKLELDKTGGLPDFKVDHESLHGNWKVGQLPQRLMCRHVDLGDVSPSNTSHFVAALNSSAQGIQVDFDDGHCPTWSNHLKGLYNVYLIVHDKLKGVPSIKDAPILMLRPRAWNMVEHSMLVNGKEVYGPLFDFGLLMFHNAKTLLDIESGPFFYLSKLEGKLEARLWDRIFTWCEKELSLPYGCTKACVLIENVLAAFEMEEILFELRHHTMGLNCGIWDYSSSFINKFGHRPEFILPDRNKYVSMESDFLKSYMNLVIKTCHKHSCHATGGMAALLLPPSENHPQYDPVMQKVLSAKWNEIEAGVDGFLVYDIRLVKPAQELFQRLVPNDNQWLVTKSDVIVRASDLLKKPSGNVTMAGLKHNIKVGILFIHAWLMGQGHFYFNGAVEDSATAEISRSQVWQWIRHRARTEDSNEVVTMATVHTLVNEVVKEQYWFQEKGSQFIKSEDKQQLQTAAEIFEIVVTKRDFPEFITTYLNHDSTFLSYQEKLN